MKNIALSVVAIALIVLTASFLGKSTQIKSQAASEAIEASAFKQALQLSDHGYEPVSQDFATASSGLKNLALKEPYTVEAWVYPTVSPDGFGFGTHHTYQTVLQLQRPDPYYYGWIPNYKLSLQSTYVDMKLQSIRPLFEIETATNGIYDNIVRTQGVLKTGESNTQNYLKNNSWNHIAVTAKTDGNTCTISVFANGHKADTSSKSTTGNDCFTYDQKSNAFTIGIANYRPADTYNQFPKGVDVFYGKIDEIRLNRNIVYSSNFFVPTQQFKPGHNTVALWHLNSNGLSEVNNINLTLYGNALFVASKHK